MLQTPTPLSLKPIIYTQKQHPIRNQQIDPDALRVIQRLQENDYSAYLVGGGVRDLLAGIEPKDFDISTSAKPEEIRALFGRQCILIGRRFRLAHVRFGKKALEVSTFRSGDSDDAELITRDNVWGTEEQDVLRRDFTCNGLFYDPNTGEVIDYVGGWKDIQKRTISCIGVPKTRFHQDPVRMIRALKFQARLGFDIENTTRTAIRKCRDEIRKSSPARLLEEMFKMLESGASEPFFHLMTEYGFTKILIPNLHEVLTGGIASDVYAYLEASDTLQSKTPNGLDRGLLLASLLYPILEEEVDTQFLNQGNRPTTGDILLLTSALIKDILMSAFTHFPKRIAGIASYTLTMQYRLTPVSAKRHFRPHMMHQKDFYHSIELLEIRSLIDSSLAEEHQSWSQRYYRSRHEGEKRHHPPPKPKQRRRRRRDS